MPEDADATIPFTDREALLFLFGGFEAMRASLAPERSEGALAISAVVRRHLYRQYGWPDAADADLRQPLDVSFVSTRRVAIGIGEQDSAELARLASEAGLTAADIVREAMRIGVWAIKEGIAAPRPLAAYE